MIPFFGDQHRNAVRAVRAGYAKMLDFKTISTDLLTNAVNEMMINTSYADKMREISSIYSDNLVHPMDETMFWIEYVIRYSGAKHLKSYATNMTWFSYLLLDILLVNLLIICSIVILVVFLIRKCRNKFWNYSKGKKEQ